MLGMMGVNYLWQEWPFYPWQYFGLAIPPSIYLFLRSLLNSNFRFENRQLWHYAPYILNFVYHLAVGLQGAEFASWWQQNIDQPYFIYAVADGVELVQHVIYLILSVRLFRQYRSWIEREFSNLDKVEFAWFQMFLIVFALKTVEVWAFSIYYLFVGEQYHKLWWGLFADTVMTYFLSIFGYAQPNIRGLHFQSAENASDKPDLQDVTPTRNIDMEAWKARVLDYFEGKKPWLEPELTLSDLAVKMGTNPSVLSQVVNTGFGKNFNDFVNGYRVEAFRQKIRAPESAHLTLLAVALDCGFNSKATFNRAFRKLTGFSPKEFVAQNN